MDEYEAPLEPVGSEKRPRGCFFYGCLAAVFISLLFLVFIGLGAYSLYRGYMKAVAQYTSTTPMKLPRVELPEDQAKALDERVAAFKKSLDTGKDVQPLVLTADEINALIAKEPQFQDRVHVEIPGDQLEGQISLPLDQIGLPGLKGRYLNGKARFNASLRNGVLFVTLDTLEVNGKPVPEQSLASLRAQNLAAGYADDPENAAAIRKLESIEVKDGKLIVKPRARTEEDEKAETKAEEKTKSEDKAEEKTKSEDKAEEKSKSDEPAEKTPEPSKP